MLLGAFNATGYLVAFLLSCFTFPFTVTMYVREKRGQRRPKKMAQWTRGMYGAGFVLVSAGLRRFVFHH